MDLDRGLMANTGMATGREEKRRSARLRERCCWTFCFEWLLPGARTVVTRRGIEVLEIEKK